MKIFLASTSDKNFLINDIKKVDYVLESFYYVQEWQKDFIKNKKWKMFLLDSGAFTFFSGNKNINWEKYVELYADFIIENNVDYFFELDIDSIVGYKKVLILREKLESLTCKKCIPVWHKSRGIQEYKKLCKEYPYIAIGGIAIKDISIKQYQGFPALIQLAHTFGCKVHGLGFTQMAYLDKIHFDSVDSTAWKSGGRFGQIHRFNGSKIVQIKKPKGKRIKSYKDIDAINLREWIKFQQYAKINL